MPPICVFLIHGTYRITYRLPEAKEMPSLPSYGCTSLPEVEQEVSSLYVFHLYGTSHYLKWRCRTSVSSLSLVLLPEEEFGGVILLCVPSLWYISLPEVEVSRIYEFPLSLSLVGYKGGVTHLCVP